MKDIYNIEFASSMLEKFEVEVEVEVATPIKNNYYVDYFIRYNRDILIFNYNTGQFEGSNSS